MPSARLWPGSRLVVGWIAAVAGFVLLRWVLIRGVFETAIVDQEVRRISGLWPEEFASLITVLGAGIVIGMLTWWTGTWMSGRQDRAAIRAGTVPVHRRILM